MQKRVEVNRTEPVGEFLCIATFLPMRRWRHVIPFLRMGSRVEKQLKATQGLVRYGLRANLFSKRFWTFSVWTDRDSVNAFVAGEPHATAVGRMSEWAGEGAAFVEWTSSDGSINWKEAAERMKNPTFHYRRTDG